ncbi:protamine-like protein 99C [Drosophila guanche]|uniref:protamine-like protein 99C n=1 Tax=Drosophila guanche TaxID=7266 RepID=UPI0014712998|nr:protamine-like protein 99C [Drosophila guanche]
MGTAVSCDIKPYKAQRVGPVTRNGYLNFLRDFKTQHVGLSPKEMVRKGAKAWNALDCKEKDRYRRMGPPSNCKTLAKCKPKRRKTPTK